MFTVLNKKGVAAAVMAAGLTLSTWAHADVEAARKALANNDYAGAIQSLDAVLQDNPGDAEAQFLKGLALARSGDTRSALKVFEQLTKSQPNMAEAWNNLGVLRARQGELKGARDALQQAVKINPQHGPAQENLGDVYVALARNAYSRAGELESDNEIARAKSRKLGSFIGDAGVIGPSAANASQGQAGAPPTVSNVTAGPKGHIVIDTSTPQTAVNSWAQAWSAQDVGAYLDIYGDDFKPADAPSRSAWADTRRERLRAPERIEVNLSDMQVSRRGRQALVRFDQRYVSNTYSDQERKALLLEQSPEGWKIVREGKAGDVDFTAPAGSGGSPAMPGGESSDGSAANAPEPMSTPQPATATGSAPAPADESGPAVASAGQAASTTNAPAGDEQARAAVRSALQSWAQAWSEQNVQAYLNAYSDNYEPQHGHSLAAWANERRQHLTGPSHIDVDLSDMKIDLLGSKHAVVTFDQHYKSSTYEDREHKRVELELEDGGWRIVSER